jgi:hypothetical protein
MCCLRVYVCVCVCVCVCIVRPHCHVSCDKHLPTRARADAVPVFLRFTSKEHEMTSTFKQVRVSVCVRCVVRVGVECRDDDDDVRVLLCVM